MIQLDDFKSIFDVIKMFPDEQSCIDYLETMRWNGNVVSPFDSESTVYKCAVNRYKCKNTGKYFNVKVGTIFEDTKIPLQKWFMALYIFSSHKKGISSHQLAKDLSITQKSAWFVLHRLRYAFDTEDSDTRLGTEVELDETFMGGEEKNKHANKRVIGTQGRSTKTKKPVFGMKERGGKVVAQVVEDTKQATIQPIVKERVIEGSTVHTDEWHAYNGLGRIGYKHQRVNHSAKVFVNGMSHTNGLENFWSHLKRTIDGTYHWCSVKHLQTYVDECALRYNSRKISTSERFNLILVNSTGKLSYKTLIAKTNESKA